MCEQLGQEPDKQKMPLESTDFPVEVQVAFFMYSLLSDRIHPMEGVFLGKEWAGLNTLFDIYEIDDRKTTFFFMKLYESIQVKDAIEKHISKQNKEKRNAAPSGKKFAYKVNG